MIAKIAPSVVHFSRYGPAQARDEALDIGCGKLEAAHQHFLSAAKYRANNLLCCLLGADPVFLPWIHDIVRLPVCLKGG